MAAFVVVDVDVAQAVAVGRQDLVGGVRALGHHEVRVADIQVEASSGIGSKRSPSWAALLKSPGMFSIMIPTPTRSP